MDRFTARPTGGAITKRAWASLCDAVTAMPVLFLSAMALMVALSVAAEISTLSHLAMTKPELIAPDLLWPALGMRIALALAWAILAAPVAVAMHRFILLGQVSRGPISYRPHYTLAFIGWLVSIRFVFEGFDIVPLLLALHHTVGAGKAAFHPPLGAALALFGVSNILLVIDVYLTMLFPAVATEAPSRSLPDRLETSMQQVRGHFWLFVWSFILAFLPVVIMNVLVGFSLLRPLVDATTKNVPIPMLQRMVGAVLQGMLQTVYVALAAAVASWLYSWVSHSSASSSSAAAVSG